MQRRTEGIVLAIYICHSPSSHELLKDSADVGGGRGSSKVEQRLSVRVVRGFQVVMAVVKEKTNVREGAMIDSEH